MRFLKQDHNYRLYVFAVVVILIGIETLIKCLTM